MKFKLTKFSSLLLALCLIPAVAEAQTQPTAFTYQGRLTDGGVAANGTYDFQFGLYDDEGNLLILLVPVTNVSVVNGIFTASPNFGTLWFAGGGERFLEVRVKKPGDTEFTTLTPRQRILSTPYSLRSLNAEVASDSYNLGGRGPEEYVDDFDPRLSDARDPNPGSASYIQNTPAQQASSNFNISGTGTAGIFNSTTQYNIGGSRVLSIAGPDNTFVGLNTGPTSTNGGNSLIGSHAGFSTTSATFNSFVGASAGFGTTTGSNNSFLGVQAGESNTTGGNNTFIGRFAGSNNATGNSNTAVGSLANVGSGNLSFATAIGAGSSVGTSNTLVLGRDADLVRVPGNQVVQGTLQVTGTLNASGTLSAAIVNAGTQFNLNGLRFISGGSGNTGVGTNTGTGGSGNSFFGFTAGFSNTSGNHNSFFGNLAGREATGAGASENSFFGSGAGRLTTSGSRNAFFGYEVGATNTTGSNNTLVGTQANVSSGNLSFATAIGAGATVSTSNTIALGRSNGLDKVRFVGIGDGPGFPICRNANFEISLCTAGLGDITNSASFRSGLDLIKRLQPISFEWKEGGARDIGLGAQDVAAVEPLLATYDENGEVAGVKYDRLGVVLLNAVKEQQAQIERQQKQIDEQRAMIEGLRQLACASSPQSSVCRVQEDKENEN